jgi:hypothetical protein
LPSKKAILSIANPCSENWAAMSDAACGKFCGACQKHVIDFTDMSDTELGRVINTTKGEICGRMTQAQMNRTIILETYPSHWSARWVLAFTALASFSGTLLAKPFYHLPDIKIFQSEKKDLKGIDKPLRRVKVRLVDSLSKEPVAFSSAVLKTPYQLVNADIDGVFQFSVPDSTSFIEIEFIYIGFHSKIVYIDLNEIMKDPFWTFELTQKAYSLNQVEVVANSEEIYSTKSSGMICIKVESKRSLFWYRFLNLFKRKREK